MATPQFALGQYETPLDIADLMLGFVLHRPTDRVLDPSCGAGALLQRAVAWQEWLAPSAHDMGTECWYGVELDAGLAEAALTAVPQAQIYSQNFFALDPSAIGPVDVIVGNPPYTRASAIGSFEQRAAQQMTLFPEVAQDPATVKLPLVSQKSVEVLGGRSGLYAHFLLHCTPFLREGGRLAFVVPNGWLDIAYGQALKRYLLEHYRIRAIIESSVERWFVSARINTCLIILEKCGNLQRRRNSAVHLVRLQRPLVELLPKPGDYRRLVEVERLVTHLTPGRDTISTEAIVHVMPQKELAADQKWGRALRAPALYAETRKQPDLAPLQQWLRVERGYTTGANAFFYLTPETIEEWSIEPRFRAPLLKSLRGLARLRVGAADSKLEVLLIPPGAELRGTAVANYIAWGVAQGYAQRTTCAARQPWYSLPHQEAAPLVLPKGIWQRHLTPLLLDGLGVDQQLYQLYPAPEVPVLAAAALLNSAWFNLQLELQGRVNFGKGLLWLATYELEQIRLPDPRRLPLAQIAQLEQAILPLTERSIGASLAELEQADRQALDQAVFEILGLSPAARDAIVGALTERVTSRRKRAQSAA